MVRFLERNGVKLAFLDTGASPLKETVVIVHGWGDRHELLLPMARHLGKRHRVVAVDLRGHGRSDKPKLGYAIPDLADDVAAICERLGIGRYRLVGHSLGGAVSLDLAARYPNRVASVAAIEGAILFTAVAREGMKPLGEALRGPHWKEAMRGFVDSCFWPTDSPALRQGAYRELERLPQHVHTGVYDGVMGWDGERAARSYKKPLLYIEGGIGITDLTRLKTLCPQLVVGQAVGVSHMEIVGSPEQSLAMIERFWTMNARRKA